jgi:hypothetical protein
LYLGKALAGDRVYIPEYAYTVEQCDVQEVRRAEGEQFDQEVLGHSDDTVTAIYNRNAYVNEMQRG